MMNTKDLTQKSLLILISLFIGGTISYYFFTYKPKKPKQTNPPFTADQKLLPADTVAVKRHKSNLTAYFSALTAKETLFASSYLLDMASIQCDIRAKNLDVKQLRIINGLLKKSFDINDKTTIIKYLDKNGDVLSNTAYTSYLLADTKGLCPDLCDIDGLGSFRSGPNAVITIDINSTENYKKNYLDYTNPTTKPKPYDAIRGLDISEAVFSVLKNYPQVAVFHGLTDVTSGERNAYLVGIINGKPDFENSLYHLDKASLCPDLCD
jgi:hypothetical protein